jgi:hypothetical protein
VLGVLPSDSRLLGTAGVRAAVLGQFDDRLDALHRFFGTTIDYEIRVNRKGPLI